MKIHLMLPYRILTPYLHVSKFDYCIPYLHVSKFDYCIIRLASL